MSALIDASLSFAISVLKGLLWHVAGLPPVVVRVSKCCGLQSKVCIRSCRGDQCLFVLLFVHFLAGLCSRCCGGNVAIRIAALCKCFSISRWRGRVYACASSASVGDVHRPPVTASMPARCTDVSLLLYTEILPAVAGEPLA